MENTRKTTKLAVSAVFIVLIIVGAFIKIPIPGIPFTLQILFTTMAGLMLGGLWGGATVAIYLLMGLIGLPVFTTGGGIAYVVQPTFGYLLGFVFGAIACGLIVSKSKKKSIWIYIIASLVNMIIIYIIGVFYFYLIMTFYVGDGVSVKELVIMFFSINTIPDVFKCLLASFLSLKLSKILNKIGAKSVVSSYEIDEILSGYKDKILSGEKLNYDELMSLENIDIDALSLIANDVRKESMGDVFHTCTIINAKSGKCTEDCKFCSQSGHNKCDINEYDLLDTERIKNSAILADNCGIDNYSIVTSGRAISGDDIEKICDTIADIKRTQDINICGSIGLVGYDEFTSLKNSGMVRYHNNLESSREYFEGICSTHSYDEKIESIKDGLRAGIKVCCGGIIGMGESFSDRVNMALEISNLGVDSVPLNLFSPIEGTSINQDENISYDEFIRTIAMFRLAMPNNFIRLAGGRTLMPDQGERAFKSGANATITGDYLTLSGVDVQEDKEMIKRLGFDVNNFK